MVQHDLFLVENSYSVAQGSTVIYLSADSPTINARSNYRGKETKASVSFTLTFEGE
jgi:hypothetical protein